MLWLLLLQLLYVVVAAFVLLLSSTVVVVVVVDDSANVVGGGDVDTADVDIAVVVGGGCGVAVVDSNADVIDDDVSDINVVFSYLPILTPYFIS